MYLKSKVGNTLAKAAALRVNLNLDGSPITYLHHFQVLFVVRTLCSFPFLLYPFPGWFSFKSCKTLLFTSDCLIRLPLHRDVSQPLNDISDQESRDPVRDIIDWVIANAPSVLSLNVIDHFHNFPTSKTLQLERHASIRLCVLHEGSQGQSGAPISHIISEQQCSF